MHQVVITFAQVASIAGITVGVLLWVFRDVIKTIMEKGLSISGAAVERLLRLVLWLVWSVAVLGIIAWLLSLVINDRDTETPVSEATAYTTLQPFHLRDEKLYPPVSLGSTLLRRDEPGEAAGVIVDNLVAEVWPSGPPEPLEITLSIQENGGTWELQATDLVYLQPFSRYQHPQQNAAAWQKLGPNKPLPIDYLFDITAAPVGYAESPNLTCNLGDPRNVYERQYIAIVRNMEGFAFEGGQNLSVSLIPRTAVRLLLKEFDYDTEATAAIGPILRLELLKLFQRQPMMELSGFSMEEIERKRDEILSSPFGPGKEEIVSQYNVDYIVSVEIGE